MPKASPEFEKNFADLAYSYINNNAPKLLDFIVGFQVLDHDEDESKAVGVFGFAVGGQKKEMFYAPVFFINGKLKGQELLYNGKDLFLPMEEGWVDFILNKKPAMIGQESDDTRGYLSRYLPNFRDMLGQGLNKSAYAAEADPDGIRFHGSVVRGAAFDVLPAIGMFFEPDDAQWKSASERLSLAAAVKEDFPLLHTLAIRMSQYPEMTKLACDFYSVTDFVTDEPTKPATQPTEKKVVKKATTSAHILSGEEVFANAEMLNPEQKKSYIKQGFVVVDEREPEEKSTLVDGSFEFQPPSSSGCYDVVFEDQSVKRCLVVRTVDNYCDCCDSTTSYKGGRVLFAVYDPESGILWERLEQVCTLTDCPTAPVLDCKGLEVLKSTELYTDSGTKYNGAFIVAEDGLLFRVPNNASVIESPKVRAITESSSGARPVFIVPKDACKMILIPSNQYEKRLDAKAPLNAESLKLADIFTCAVIKAASAGGSHINFSKGGNTKQTSSRLESISYLVCDLGLSKEAAEEVLNKTLDEGLYSFAVKQAYSDFIGDYEPEAPSMSRDDYATMGSEPWSGAMMTEDVVRDEPVSGLPVNSRSDYGEMDPDVYGTAERAVATKQKDIFDVAILSSLLKTTDTDNLIDKYLPDLVKAVDRFGRMLFLMYNNLDDFKERYGETDLAELEDTLKSAFTTVGKLVLFMKKRSISSDVDDKPSEL